MTDLSAPRSEKLQTFQSWVGAHLSGDEKGEAQIYLDRFFQAFGWPGLKEAGASCELRVKNDNGGTSFADLVWKPTALVEMKKRGADLSRHYRQAFDYWTHLVPGRPRYAVLCNFDEFWVYDFETQMDTPVDKVKLSDLHSRYGALAFFFPGNEAPIFGNHQEKVTREAADKLAACFNSLVARGVDRDAAQRFTLQLLMAFFAEDIGLLDKYLVVRLLEECKTPADSYDLIGGLFEAMNTPGGVTGGRFKGVQYFNGGLFARPAQLELNDAEVQLLRDAAHFDWSKVRPEIFGALFEHSLGKEERHAYGAHFTSAADIMKIVTPTIVEPWRERIESERTLRGLRNILQRLHHFKVLDPACGSGNFLYIAYREIKRLEARIYERMGEEFKSVNPDQRPFGFVTAGNFHGMDINPFAVEIAKVTMMLAHKLAIDELHITENALPLDNLDSNFSASDALIQADGSRTLWPNADAIIGNPPFLGTRKLKPARGATYVDAIRRAYPEVPGMADYCVYWFRRAHDALKPCTVDDPFTGRAGLVGTQNIRSNQSRVGGLDYIVKTGTIVEAVDNQPWSGEANVNVSIASWIKTQDPKLLPAKRRLWFKSTSKEPADSRKPASKSFSLNVKNVFHINSALSDRADLSGAKALVCNYTPKMLYQGVTPGHDAFVLTHQEREQLERDGVSGEVIHPYLTGRELVTGDGTPERFIIDFQRRSILEVSRYSNAFRRIEELVLPARQKKGEKGEDGEEARSHHKGFLDRWWALSWDRAEFFARVKGLRGRYIACSRITKRPIFVFLTTAVWPSDKVQAFLFDDDYSFGVLQSSAHWAWFLEKCSKLTERFSYSSDSVFDTFPWPQKPSTAQIEAVADAGRKVRAVRQTAVAEIKGGLRAVYRTLELPGQSPLKDAHAALDDAVLQAYGFSSKDVLEQLMALNEAVSGALESGQLPTGPGVPPTYKTPEKLITADRLGA